MFTDTVVALTSQLNTTGGDPVAAKAVAEQLGDELSARVGKRVNLSKVTKRDAAILMIAFGACDFSVKEQSNTVARRMRSNRFAHGSWGALI